MNPSSDNDNIVVANYDLEINLPTFIEMSRKARREENNRKLQELDLLIADENEKINKLNEIGISHFAFNNTNGYVISKIPDHIRAIVDKRVIEAYYESDERDSLHNILAGNIEKQYPLPIDDELEYYLSELCKYYISKFPEFFKQMSVFTGLSLETDLHTSPNTIDNGLEIFSLWANYMKKTEYNPIHHHTGLFSFVIWHKVPYDLKTEILNSPSKRLDATNSVGCFEFMYPSFNYVGMEQHILRVDNKYEGVICVFPAYMNHVVWPFYSSDEYRISVSGNIKPTTPPKYKAN